MPPRRLTTLYIKALTATWILVIVPLTMGAYSCTAFQRRSECCYQHGVEPGPVVAHGYRGTGPRRASLATDSSTQGASSDQGGSAWKSNLDTQGLVSMRSNPRASLSDDRRSLGSTLTGVRSGRHLEVPSGQLWEVTQYSHMCTLPPHGHDKVARRAANGRWPIADVTIATDPSIPFGTELLIEGLGFRTVGDRGSAIKGRKIDVFVDSCREAKAFGRQWLKVYPVPSWTTRQAGLEISND